MNSRECVGIFRYKNWSGMYYEKTCGIFAASFISKDGIQYLNGWVNNETCPILFTIHPKKYIILVYYGRQLEI